MSLNHVRGSEIQSILFNKISWSKQEAKNWMKKHNYKPIKLDVTKNYYRYRQTPPNYKKYRMKTLPNDIMLVLGYNRLAG